VSRRLKRPIHELGCNLDRVSIAMSLGQAASPAFNSLFYGATAAVIPALFIAIAVQGSAYNEFFSNFFDAADMQKRWGMNVPARRQTATGIVVLVISLAVPVAGTIGEIASLLALDDQAAAPGTETVVLVTTIFLLLTATWGTFLQFLQSAEETPKPSQDQPTRTGKSDTG